MSPHQTVIDELLAQGVTQTELAKRIGVSLPYLNQVICRRKRPSQKVLDYLGLRRVISYERTGS